MSRHLCQTYPDEDERVGVPHSVLPLRYLDHGELHWACAMAHEALHLWAVATEARPSSPPEYPSPFTYGVKLSGVPMCHQAGAEVRDGSWEANRKGEAF